MQFKTLAPVEIGRVIADHSAAAIRTQEILDRAAQAAAVPTARMRIDRFEFSSDWGLERADTVSFEIKATPLNLSYRASRRLTASTDLRIQIVVEQMSLPQGFPIAAEPK